MPPPLEMVTLSAVFLPVSVLLFVFGAVSETALIMRFAAAVIVAAWAALWLAAWRFRWQYTILPAARAVVVTKHGLLHTRPLGDSPLSVRGLPKRIRLQVDGREHKLRHRWLVSSGAVRAAAAALADALQGAEGKPPEFLGALPPDVPPVAPGMALRLRLLDEGFLDMAAEPDRLSFHGTYDLRRTFAAVVIGLGVAFLGFFAQSALAPRPGARATIVHLVAVLSAALELATVTLAVWPAVRSPRGGTTLVLPRGRRELFVTREPGFLRRALFRTYELTEQSFVCEDGRDGSATRCYLRGPRFDYAVAHDVSASAFDEVMRFSIFGEPLPSR